MSNNKLTLSEKAEIVNLVASTKMTQTEIAAQYNISARRVGQLAQQYRDIVDEKQADSIALALERANGSMVTSKIWRMQQYERDLIKLDHQFTADAINARTRILGQAAKELGDIAPTQHNIKAEVSHIIGIDMSRALPAISPMMTAEVIEVDATELEA